MKRQIVVELLILTLIFLVFSNAKVSKANVDLLTAYPVPEGICDVEPIPATSENFNEDYSNTTNPYSNTLSPMSAIDEVDDIEAHHPIYVLVAGDEEERAIWRTFGGFHNWISWATLQIERGDESLAANFGIDIRILGFIEWDSDDSKTTMTGLWYDLETKTSQYLRQICGGNGWTNYVDAIIGVTAQATPNEPNKPGKAPPPEYLDQGRVFILLKWQVYWMDDNIVQHEVSHLFYADDHWYDCCVMAGHQHTHYLIQEDGMFWLFPLGYSLPCAYTAYSWDNDCFTVMEQHKSKYQSDDLPILIDWWDVFEWICVTRYLWLNETTNTFWIENKGIGMPVGVRRH